MINYLSIALMLLLSICQVAKAQFTESRLLASDGEANDFFGRAVAVFGDYMVIGAPGDDDVELNAGAAYVFVRQGDDWIEHSKLTASDGTSNDNFGHAVAIFGDRILVGAPFASVGSYEGAAYVYALQDGIWEEEQQLISWDQDDFYGASFGSSVALNAEYALVGDPGDHCAIGTILFYRRVGSVWSNHQSFSGTSSGSCDNFFGTSVALSDACAIAGQPNSSIAYEPGLVKIYSRAGDSWSQVATMSASDGTAVDLFGSSVAIAETYAIVGKTTDATNGSNAGAAYILHDDGSGWSEQAKVLASDGGENHYFGSSVAISGELALVGASGADGIGDGTGAVYLYHRSDTTWTEGNKLYASDGAAGDLLGGSVSIYDSTYAVGASGADSLGSNAGSAYVYALPGTAISCEEVDAFKSRCLPDSTIAVKLRLNNFDHDGEEIEIRIDSVDTYSATIAGRLASFTTPPYDPGFHTVEITDPPDCVAPITVKCNLPLVESGGQGEAETLPTDIVLFPNHPNPFNPTTTIRYQLPDAQHVRLAIYDLLGREVATLINGSVEAGYHEVVWDGTKATGEQVASGVYLYRIAAGEFVETRRMLLMR